MNCEKCQELLGDFVEGTLTPSDRALLDAHFEECLNCLSVSEDLSSIVSFCRDHRGEYESPPNEHAMWLRIRNIIESEDGRTMAAAGSTALQGRGSRWSSLLNRSWQLSLPQAVTAIAALIVAVSLATAFSLRKIQRDSTASPAPSVADLRQPSEKGSSPMDGGAYLVDERVSQQLSNINYWSQRVEQQQARWTPRMRQTFERNLSVYEQAVEDSRRQLRKNPHDEISEEMLHAALDDKMELLKEFSSQ